MICLHCKKPFERKGKSKTNFCSNNHRNLYQWSKGGRKSQRRILDMAKVRLDIMNGESVPSIAKKIGVDNSTVYRALTKLGLASKSMASPRLRVWLGGNLDALVISYDPQIAARIETLIKLTLAESTLRYSLRVFRANEKWERHKIDKKDQIPVSTAINAIIK